MMKPVRRLEEVLFWAVLMFTLGPLAFLVCAVLLLWWLR